MDPHAQRIMWKFSMAVTVIAKVKEDSVVTQHQTTFTPVVVTCGCVSEQIWPSHITTDSKLHFQQMINPVSGKSIITYNSYFQNPFFH